MRSNVNHISCTCVQALVQRFPNSNVTFNGHKHSRLDCESSVGPSSTLYASWTFYSFILFVHKVSDHRNMYHKCHHLGARLRSSFFLFICKDTPCSVNVANGNQGISVATQSSIDVRVAFVLKQHNIFFLLRFLQTVFPARTNLQIDHIGSEKFFNFISFVSLDRIFVLQVNVCMEKLLSRAGTDNNEQRKE